MPVYMMCVLNDSQQTTHDYTEVSQAEEARITRLLRGNGLPEAWQFKGKRIITTTILGFTDNPMPYKPPTPPQFKSFDELRQWAFEQKWYRKKFADPEPKAHRGKAEEIVLDLKLLGKNMFD